MQFALINGVRSTAQPKTSGTCQFCGDNMIARCGRKTIWHWAHSPKRNCDPWWENETPWHRKWKSRFPEDWRERVYQDPIMVYRTYFGRVLRCIQYVSKRDLIESNGGVFADQKCSI